MTNILAIDDDAVILALYRKLQSFLGKGYEVFTVSSPKEACALLEKTKVDFIISDLNMPEVSGLEFLKHVGRLMPGAFRIVISSNPDQLHIAETLNLAHQYFCKPIDLSNLNKIIKRFAHYKYLVKNDWIRQMVFQTGDLPIVPAVCLKLTRMLESPYTQINDIAEVVEADAGITSRLLHIVNSAHMGVARRITSCAEAIQIVGLEVVRNVIVGMELIHCFKDHPYVKETYKKLWAHSLKTAVGARRLAQSEGESTEACNGRIHSRSSS